MTVRTSAATSFTVSAAATPGGPDWWQDATFVGGSWRAMCTAAATRIKDIFPNPIPTDAFSYSPGGVKPTNPYGMCDAWNGAVVDEAGKKYMFVGNGGDADYCGNEVYELDLSQNLANLKWRRVGEPTLNGSALGGGIYGTADDTTGSYSDGGRKSDHTCWSQFYYAGKVWHVILNSCWARRVDSGAWTWDRAVAATGARGGNWGAYLNNGPWVRRANMPPSGNYQFPTGAFDSTTGIYWRMSQYNLTPFFKYDTASPTTYQEFTQATQSFSVDKEGASCIAADAYDNLKCWILCEGHSGTLQRLAVMDISNASSPTLRGIVNTTPLLAWEDPARVGTMGAVQFHGGNLIYHNGALYYSNPAHMGPTIRKLVIPTTGSGSSKRPDMSGSWVWTTLPPGAFGGLASNKPTGYPWAGASQRNTSAGSYSKFNIIRDMGDGRAAFVLLDHLDMPTYVYKLPIAGETVLVWTAPTLNSVGLSFNGSTPDRTLVGYRIYYGTNQYDVMFGGSASVASSTSPYVFTGLTTGTWYFRIVTLDGDGDESTNTDTYTKVIP